VEVYEADMNDAAGVYRACDGVDAIVHLAAQMKQGNSTVQRMVEINSFGTLNVLEGALRSSTKIRSILLAGTDQAYHPFVSDRTTFYEDHPQRPIDIYALTKLISEQMFYTYQREYQLPVKIMRFGSVIAADEPLQLFYPAWLDLYVNDEWTAPGKVPWFGADKVEAAKAAVAEAMKTPNGVCAITDSEGNSWGLPFTDVRDTVDGITRVLDSPDAVGQAFNLVGPTATSFVNVAKLIAANSDRPYLEVKMPFLWWFNISNAKARSILGYEPRYTFPDMIESALAFRRGEDIGVVPV
ncbi:MAG: NAD(P)-dependent oxidoreductase, partial [Caldilineaceae bacterium]|nr:NAD(P)-dependent oxidoreductase [Caldilineaceae bacterium]